MRKLAIVLLTLIVLGIALLFLNRMKYYQTLTESPTSVPTQCRQVISGQLVSNIAIPSGQLFALLNYQDDAGEVAQLLPIISDRFQFTVTGIPSQVPWRLSLATDRSGKIESLKQIDLSGITCSTTINNLVLSP